MEQELLLSNIELGYEPMDKAEKNKNSLKE